MKQLDLTIKPRGTNSKNGNRRARRHGELPAVVYGGERDPMSVLLDAVGFEKMLHLIHGSTIFNLKSNGEGDVQQAIIREIQRDPVSEQVLHVDFYRIQADKPVVVEIPIHGVGGVPAGVRVGGVLEVLIRRVKVKCLPLQVPEFFEIDISGLEIGRTLHVSDLKVPEGIELLTAPEEVLFIVAAPKAEEEAKPAEEGAAQPEPELIGKEKKEGEEEEAAEGKKEGKKEEKKPEKAEKKGDKEKKK